MSAKESCKCVDEKLLRKFADEIMRQANLSTGDLRNSYEPLERDAIVKLYIPRTSVKR